MATLEGKRILVGVTGGIAAYKTAELVRRLQDEGASVRVAMTDAATAFITPLTMQALSGHPVHRHLMDEHAEAGMGHIELAKWSDAILVAPATADFMARLAAGMANDLLSAVCLASERPIALAPSMNQAMWLNQATQTNADTLEARGLALFGPDSGSQACGDVGPGRMMEVPEILEALPALFDDAGPASTAGALAGARVVITAGPTREAIDPVRFISNHSSGKQGFALAEAAAAAGAEVELIAGPTHLPTPSGVKRVDVVSTRDMYDAALASASGSAVFIGVAAVCDYRPDNASVQKIKKEQAAEGALDIHLVENPDIIACIAQLDPKPFTVGFAAETENLVEYAKDKLARKGLDMIVANDVSDAAIGFNSDSNRTTVLWRGGMAEISTMSKEDVATRIIGLIATRQQDQRA